MINYVAPTMIFFSHREQRACFEGNKSKRNFGRSLQESLCADASEHDLSRREQVFPILITVAKFALHASAGVALPRPAFLFLAFAPARWLFALPCGSSWERRG